MPKSSVQKQDRISVRIAPDIKRAATSELEKRGLSLSNYIQFALANIASGESDYLNTPSALAAKEAAEHDQNKQIGDGTIQSFNKYLETIKRNEN
ncbi:type II toxin-antitoxin system RelB/DinJ family antitoxin (plasmid) [Nicoliella spurrieriana]|uniref:Type II toxin-antitoxin system RelB/DinJ family antitoxin n=1 Tax=Nicoliella spurrieriana TaxID=2925830 RepID=A0A976X4X4_9LACO|nr:type II toxin-antitoxin system RelB/DinJ family antitoxin [Nicoliella spurrieriana]UQS86220.1 type II toxin-antitoxin system RelB/DinJ family antitoxin [Nicoliella spurrieriana]